MRAMKLILVLPFVVALSVTSARAQSFKKGNLSGVIQSFSATVAAGGSATVMTTPASGFFIMTQWCSDFSSGTLSASGLGALPRDGSGTPSGTVSERCTSYSPGIALPASSTVSYANPGVSPQTIAITGVLSTL